VSYITVFNCLYIIVNIGQTLTVRSCHLLYYVIIVVMNVLFLNYEMSLPCILNNSSLWLQDFIVILICYTDKSLARPGRKQATATEDFDFHILYL